MKSGPASDRVLLAHMRDCLDRIAEYTHAERSRFDASRMVQDAVIRNLQTLAETEPTPVERDQGYRAAGSIARTCRVSQRDRDGYRSVDLGATWPVVEQDLPPLSEAVNRMTTSLGPRS